MAQTDVNQYMPASREMRDNIVTQDTFAQAAFWSHEYDLNPSDLESAIKLAAAVRKLGNASRAVEITQTSLAIHPRDPYLLAEHAAALIADERALDAMPIIDSGLRLAPQYARLWSLKGAALDQTEDYGQAQRYYARALQITPNDPNILANVGLSHALAGDPATAETWLRRAVAMPGAGAGVRRNLAVVLKLQGKTEEADRYSRTASQSRGPRQMPTPQPAYQMRGAAPSAQRPAQRQAQQQPQRATPPMGLQRGPQTRLMTTRPDGTPFASAAEAARAAAMQRSEAPAQPRQAPAPLPDVDQMSREQQDVLAQISRNIGPQAATPPGATGPRVVGPALRAPQPQQPPAMQGGYPAPYGAPQAAPAPDRRGAARRRR